MLNDLMEKRKKTLAESEEHKNRRNELNASASKFARDRNTLNNQTREFVEEAQKNKDLRDKYNQESLISRPSATSSMTRQMSCSKRLKRSKKSMAP